MPTSLSAAAVVIDAATSVGIPVLLNGGPGIGKTSLLSSLAHARGAHLEVVIASVHEPADFNGLPIVTGDVTKMAPPAWVRRVQAHPNSIVLIDEANSAPPSVQAALLRLVLEKVVGDEALPEGTRFVAAMNPVDIAAGGWDLSAPLANRFCHIEVAADADTWVEGMLSGWSAAQAASLAVPVTAARAATARGRVTAFIKANPNWLYALPDDPGQASGAWPSPRSWDHLIRLLPAIPDGDEASGLLAAEGLVGARAADELLTWAAELNLPNAGDVLTDPGAVDWAAERGDRLLAILTSVVAATGPETFDRALDVVAAAMDAGRRDIVAAVIKPLLALRPPQVIIDRSLLASFAPLLARAGKIS